MLTYLSAISRRAYRSPAASATIVSYLNNGQISRCPTFLLAKRRFATERTVVSQLESSKVTADTQTDRPKDPLDLTFTDTVQAYKSKTTWELVRALIVFKFISYDFIVNNHERLIKVSKSILGSYLFKKLMRGTFYGHFVAGENEQEIRPVIERLMSFGVKSILDYSAEEDLSEEAAVTAEMSSIQSERHVDTQDDSSSVELKKFSPQKDFADRRKYNITARTYFYLNEAQCEKNMEIFLKCIDAVAGATDHTGLAAIKLTALGRPQILLQLSEVIVRTRMLFKEITGEDKMIFSKISPEDFQAKYRKRFDVEFEGQEIKEWFRQMDFDQRGLMNLFSWNGLVDMRQLASDVFKVPNLKTKRMDSITRALSREEAEMFRNMMRRVHNIAQHAKEKDVRVMIDAEQSYFQPAINRITLELMRKYNTEKAIVFNTYQCYLKSAYDSVMIDLELARRQNFYWAAKLVRGAYMDQERARAKQVGYEDPINPTFEATSEMYHRVLSEVMDRVVATGVHKKKISCMVASHNEDTIRFTVQKMKECGIQPEHKVICFGQLYGMCDQISFPLGQSGYSVYKYVPYGPVDEVMPYIARRGAENHGTLTKVKKERKMLAEEVKRRLRTGQLFYRPEGNYRPI